MRPVSQPLALWTTGALLVASLTVLQLPLNHWHNSKPKLQPLMYLPDGGYLRMASLGYRELAADVFWLQAIQVMGERKVTAEAGHWLFRVFDLITTLDPKFVRVYEVGSLALCTLVVLPEESNRILEKGMQHNPLEWKLPFLLGINYFFEFADDKKSAEFMTKAAHLPGAPDFIARFAAKLYVSAKSPQEAVDLLTKLYDETVDENVRKHLALRLKETIVERDLSIVEQSISRYVVGESRPPERLEDLVKAGLLREVPREPFGGQYIYDPRTGTVRSSVVKERMRITASRRSR